MNRFRPIILAAVVALSALLAYGLFTLPKAQPETSEGFSSARVIKDIEVISREHHSVAHPQERVEVREYLVQRLHELNADTVKLFEYDSLVGPKNRHVEYTFDAVNVLAEFDPENVTDSTTYVMLIAHYDSRYSQPMPKDTVWSYGAADDGYGLGVILETVSQALKQHSEWNQGVKVLFTDAEEVGRMGMIALLENQREELDNVGLVINFEARGPWGPALLFETCAGNEKVMELYEEHAEYPYTYSLTTVVYSFMPMYTDFTEIKDEIPGLNFSTIADVNHYHTDKDNFSNVSGNAIQHYGTQILPIVVEYLTNPVYADKSYLYSDEDTVNFTIPALGLLNVSKLSYKIINLAIFFVFMIMFALEYVRGRLKSAKAVFKVSAFTLLSAIGVVAVGELVAYISCLVAGAKFIPFGTIYGVQFDNAVMIAAAVLMALICMLIYHGGKKKAMRSASNSMRASASATAASQHAYRKLYGALALMFVLSAALLFAIGENLMFLIPLCFATAAMVLYHLTTLKLWIPLAMACILLHAFSFLYALAMALTIGAYGAVLMLAYLDLMVLIPLGDIYLMNSKK